MQNKRELQDKIEKYRSKLSVIGLTYGAIFGALAWVVVCEFWLNQSPPRKDLGIIVELIVGGLAGALLGFIIGLGKSLYKYPSWNFRVRQK